MPVGKLLSAHSPRLGGLNDDHARALAESEVTLPPIIVNRTTLNVIDGVHRLRAAVLRGRDEIEVRFFDGEERDAFVLAVEANIAHGLPLALADRTAAAARIIASHPRWSDRVIALKTGLAAKTVGVIRRRSIKEDPQLDARVGRDGRVRPLSTAERRTIAAKLIRDNPDAPLREIARTAGISVGTAHNVRKRLHRGNDPVLSTQHNREQRKDKPAHEQCTGHQNNSTAWKAPVAKDRNRLLNSLTGDPSLRCADSGRILLRLLSALAVGPRVWENLVESIPAHCRPMVCDAAHACAKTWQEFAARLGEQ